MGRLLAAELWRAEHGRVRRWDRRVAETGPDPLRPEAFALAVPEGTPPSATGRRCTLAYEVRARVQPGGGATTVATVPVTLSSSGRVHLGPRVWDRVIGDQPARRFHIEISEAAPYGGGTLEGRVHRDRDWGPRLVTITGRCLEAWRVPHAGPRYQLPAWASEILWSATRELEPEPGATWIPFRFEIPPGLPPAIEAHSVAWRYELLAHRRGRFGGGTPAIVTPLLFELG
jgi:hypothetical protein